MDPIGGYQQPPPTTPPQKVLIYLSEETMKVQQSTVWVVGKNRWLLCQKCNWIFCWHWHDDNYKRRDSEIGEVRKIQKFWKEVTNYGYHVLFLTKLFSHNYFQGQKERAAKVQLPSRTFMKTSALRKLDQGNSSFCNRRITILRRVLAGQVNFLNPNFFFS